MKILIFVLFITSIIAQTDSSKVGPCNDKVLLKLQAKDSLTIDEMKVYAELKRQCVENTKIRNEDQAANGVISNYTLTVIVIVVSVLIGIGILSALITK